MIKRLLISILILFSFYTTTLQAQGLLGGEIRWDCIPVGQANVGKFVFYLTIYQACYNDTNVNPILANTQLLESTSPSGNTTMTMLPNYPKDVSPICNSDTSLNQTGCGTADSISAFNGAYRVYVYADTFKLYAIPPVNGWTFTWKGGKRNRSSNLVNSLNPNMQLRSKMYSYGNQYAYPCFDAAPTFAEKPVIMTCNGYPFTTTPGIRDRELDSIITDWSQLLDTNGNNITFTSNHSYLNPLPNTFDNPNNSNAILHQNTGQLDITTYTDGGFFANQKFSAYKCGVKVAEIYRDMYFQFNNCDSNVSPQFIPPFANLKIVDSVYAGERISFNLNFVDSQLLATGALQSVKMLAYGKEFGNYIPANAGNAPIFDTMIGCQNPPCATLNAATTDSLPIFDTAQLTTHFSWQTTCSHLATNVGCGMTSNVYNFYFKYWDDYCPVPAYNTGQITIVVLPRPTLEAPELDSLAVDSSNGDVQLFWHPVVDTMGLFMNYFVFADTNQSGFALIDTLTNINDTSYIHIGANALNQNCAYYLRTESGCYTYQNWSPTSDTLYNNYSKPQSIELSKNKLWNISVAPNPAKDNISLRFNIPKTAMVQLQIFDVSGRIIFQNNIAAKSGFNSYKLDISKFESGVYFYRIQFESQSRNARFIVL